MSAKKYYTHNGMTMSLPEWEVYTGVPANVLRQRIYLKWSYDRVFSTPLYDNKQYEYEGRKYTLQELAEINGTLTTDGMRSRLRHMPVKKAVETPRMRSNLSTARGAFLSPCGVYCTECERPECIYDK